MVSEKDTSSIKVHMTIKVTFQASSTTVEGIQHDLFTIWEIFVAQASRKKYVQHF